MEWTDDLSVGVERIDEQHKELFNRINDLVTAIKSTTCIYKLPDVIQFLEDYIVKHFSEEERYMMRLDYPDCAHHRAQHGIFVRNLSILKKSSKSLKEGKDVDHTSYR